MKNNDDISKTQPLYYRIVEKSQSTSDLTGLQFHLEDNIPKGINVSHHVLNDVMDAINDAFGSKRPPGKLWGILQVGGPMEEMPSRIAIKDMNGSQTLKVEEYMDSSLLDINQRQTIIEENSEIHASFKGKCTQNKQNEQSRSSLKQRQTIIKDDPSILLEMDNSLLQNRVNAVSKEIEENKHGQGMHLIKKVQKLSLELQNSKNEFQDYKNNQGILLESKISEIQILNQKLADAELIKAEKQNQYETKKKLDWRILEGRNSSLKDKRDELRRLIKEKRVDRDNMLDRMQKICHPGFRM